MRTLCFFFLPIVIFTVSTHEVVGQGCVAVRPMSCSASGHGNNLGIMEKGNWQFSATYQYFRSFRHFRGDVEEHHRLEEHTEVVNVSNSVELSIATAVSKRFAVSASIPYLHYSRSSLYEHYGNSESSNPDRFRFNTGSIGLGDMRVTTSYWLMDPQRDSLSGNFSVGFGLKMPTGNYNVQDDFHKASSTGQDSIVHRPVDQSIQLGDGGWGISLELQGFWKLFSRGWYYFNGFYLSNPMNTNDTWRRGTIIDVDPLTANHSIPDQFSVRTGCTFILWPKAGLSVNVGGRIEGIPARDVLGKSDGYRRPGYIVSVEPGISFMIRSFNISAYAPIALYRNRIKSVSDMADPTGNRHGDAAFADYLVGVSLSYRLGSHFKQSQPTLIN